MLTTKLCNVLYIKPLPPDSHRRTEKGVHKEQTSIVNRPSVGNRILRYLPEKDDHGNNALSPDLLYGDKSTHFGELLVGRHDNAANSLRQNKDHGISERQHGVRRLHHAAPELEFPVHTFMDGDSQSRQPVICRKRQLIVGFRRNLIINLNSVRRVHMAFFAARQQNALDPIRAFFVVEIG